MKITPEIRQAAHRNAKNSGILRVYREVKALEAATRDEARKALTPEQQLARLDRRLGKGQGAVKERARLSAQMNPMNDSRDM